MANYYPLIVNQTSKKIEELKNNDNLDLTNNNIIADSVVGTSGQYLKSDGSKVIWGTAGDVYLAAPQTISNKIFDNSVISGIDNTLFDVPNSSLQNSSININGSNIALGGSVVTPNDNTTYSISAIDGASAAEKIVRLIGANPSSNDDITFIAGSNVALSRIGDSITITSSYIDTITRVQGGVNGTPVTGDVVLQVTGTSSISQNGNVITIDADKNVDTITRLKGEITGTFTSGDVTLVQGGATTITQSSLTPEIITISSQDTITRVRGGVGGALVSGDITIVGATDTTVTQVGSTITVDTTNTITTVEAENNGSPVTGAVRILGGTNVTTTQSNNDITVSSIDTITRIRGTNSGAFAAGDFTFVGADDVEVTQSGNIITISSSDQDTITRLRGTTGGTYTFGDITITGTNAATVTQNGSTINIDVIDQDTTYTAGTSITLSGTQFSLKNSDSLTNNRLPKWDTTNGQLVNSNISDDGTTITIGGNLTVTGTTTTVNSTVVSVADSDIELRSGNNVVAGNGGIQVNRTTNSTGGVTSYRAFQWFETGGYWRTFDGTTTNRIVTENETQTLTNKTLTSPVLTSPSLGIATATTINKVTITQPTSGATLTIAESKSLTVNNSVTLSGTDNVTVSYGGGGTIIYASNKLSALSTTTSDELRGIISDETGIGKLTFATSPDFVTSVGTTSTSFNVFNATATTINAFGAATTVNIGATTGTTTIRNNLSVNGSTTIGDNISDTVTVNGTTDFVNEDIKIRTITVGRGGAGVATDTAVGKEALRLVVGSGAGVQNTAIGYETLFFNNTGNRNTAVGFRAGHTYSSGSDNVAVGNNASYSSTIGDKNVAVGNSSLYSNVQGDYNVCLGYYAGYGLTGSGNVLIGPAWNETVTDSTYAPPIPSGNNQLVIGSGGGYWLQGNSSFNVTIPNDLTVEGVLYATGDYTYIDSRILDIDATEVSIQDKNITLGDVSTTNFTANVTQGSTSFSINSYGTGIVPGMIVVSQTDGITVPSNTFIVSIDYINSTGVLSAAPNLGSGSVTFQATGPSNNSADGGGLILKGTTDKTLTWNNTASAWTANQHFNVSTGFGYKINNVSVLTNTTLGSSVVNSSLTSLGTLSTLTISSSGSTVPLTITNTGTGDCLVVNDEASDTTPFKIGNDGTLYITGNISDNNASTGSTNQVIARKAGGGIEWKGINSLADPNTVTNAGVSTDNAIARFDLLTGKVIQTSLVTIDDNGSVNVPSGQAYQINGTSVLSATTLGSGVTASSLTSVGTLTSLTVSGTIAANGADGAVATTLNTFNGTSGGDNQVLVRALANGGGDAFIKFDCGGSDMVVGNLYAGTTNNQLVLGAGTSAANTVGIKIDGNGRLDTFAMRNGAGISFAATSDATGMTSELLDDYETGTWTPGISGRTVTATEGWYVKIGRYVTVQFVMGGINSSLTGTDIQITGLPFTSANLNQVGLAQIGDVSGFSYASGFGDVYGRVLASSTGIQLLQQRTDGSTHDAFTTGGGISGTTTFVCRGMAWYIT